MALSASRVTGASVPGLNGNGRAYASDLAAGIGGYGAPARSASGAAPGLHRAAARAREYSSTYARTAAIVEPDVDYAPRRSRRPTLSGRDWLNRYAEWRKGVPAASLTSFPHAAICQLRLSDAAGRRAYGTGFYIGNETLLTCGHNFLDAADGWEDDEPSRSSRLQPRGVGGRSTAGAIRGLCGHDHRRSLNHRRTAVPPRSGRVVDHLGVRLGDVGRRPSR